MAIKQLAKFPNIRFVALALHGNSGKDKALSDQGVAENAQTQQRLLEELAGLEPGIQARIFSCSSIPHCYGTAVQMHEAFSRTFTESHHFMSPVGWLEMGQWNSSLPEVSATRVFEGVEKALNLFSHEDLNTVILVAQKEQMKGLAAALIQGANAPDTRQAADILTVTSSRGFKESEILVLDRETKTYFLLLVQELEMA